MGAYAYLDEDFDPWESVDDLDGEAHYRVLGVPVRSSPEDIKAAYRSAIRTHHPDKGGDPAKFSILQTAWEVRVGRHPDSASAFPVAQLGGCVGGHGRSVPNVVSTFTCHVRTSFQTLTFQ